jgi:NAD(P)-dependent dehydrogenase (short-subunit alcohol dehydrogenase family)
MITGGSGGIGSETARMSRARGARERVAHELGAQAFPGDVLDSEGFPALVERIESEFGEIDGLVHAVGSILLRPLLAGSVIGIDVGVAWFAALSDGTFFEGANSFEKHQRRLARLQRRLARKVKFPANWRKAKAPIKALHAWIASIRRDRLHKASTTISKNHAVVVSGRPAYQQDDRVGQRHHRVSGNQCCGQERAQPANPRPRLGRVPSSARIQARLEGRLARP